MILVTLGTQDKDFSRLLSAIEREINRGSIQQKVIVQAGCTRYKSNAMEVFDLISSDELDRLMREADIVITHGGVGSIITALKYHKKVIAAARLKKYGEHTNDHQTQIVKEFAKQGYLLELRDFNSLGKLLKKIEKFSPKSYHSDNDKMIHLVDDTIQKWSVNGIFSRSQKLRELFLYLFFGVFTTVINILTYYIFARLFSVYYQLSNIIAWILSVLFAFITNKLFVFQSKKVSVVDNLKEVFSFFIFRILSLLFDMFFMYIMVSFLSIDDLVSKIIVNVLVIIINYLISKILVFKR